MIGETATCTSAAARAFLSGLIDDASQYPPAQLPLDASLAQHRENRASAWSWMIGRFVSPLSKLVTLDISSEGDDLDASIVCDVEGASTQSRSLHLSSLEITARVDESGNAGIAEAIDRAKTIAGAARPELFVEFPSVIADVRKAIAQLAAHPESANVFAKLRCGGVVASAVPTVTQLAVFLKACAERKLPLKATAGLHHPVRHFNVESGFVMHGFLNVVGAALMAHQRNAGIAFVSEMIACESPQRFVFAADEFRFDTESLNVEEIARGRAFFRSYGSCSFSEPVNDLLKLGILSS